MLTGIQPLQSHPATMRFRTPPGHRHANAPAIRFGNQSRLGVLAQGVCTGLAGDMVWIMLANLLLPLAIPLGIGMTFGGIALSRYLGLHYDKKTDQFINFQKGHPEYRNIWKRVAALEKTVVYGATKPLALFGEGIEKSGRYAVRRVVSRARKYIMTNGALGVFLKVPTGTLGTVWHIAKASLVVLGLILKNRLRHGILGRVLSFALGFTAFNQMRNIIVRNPGEILRPAAAAASKTGLKSLAMADILKAVFTQMEQKLRPTG